MVERICISIPADALRRLDRAAELLHTTRSAFLREAADRAAVAELRNAPATLDVRAARCAAEVDQ